MQGIDEFLCNRTYNFSDGISPAPENGENLLPLCYVWVGVKLHSEQEKSKTKHMLFGYSYKSLFL